MNFNFYSTPRILFGAGQIRALPDIASPLGRHALLIYNGSTTGSSIAEPLRAAGFTVTLARHKGEPEIQSVTPILQTARDSQPDFIIGAGGGSALDVAKAVAGLVTNPGALLDYMEVIGHARPITKPSLPWIAIPTTAGTGAEVTRNAVIASAAHRVKASIRSPHLLPRIALVDPELSLHVPQDVTAFAGMDAMAQCIESFTSKNANPLTDGLSIEGVKIAARNLRRVVEDGGDIEAREGMAAVSLISGITLTNAGLGAVHGFAAPLGANFPVPHGVVCAALLPGVIAANIQAAQHLGLDNVLSKYAEIGRALSGEPVLSDDAAIATCPAFAAELARDLHIPYLSRYGITPSHIPDMVALAKKASSMRYNPVELADAALMTILQNSITRDS